MDLRTERTSWKHGAGVLLLFVIALCGQPVKALAQSSSPFIPTFLIKYCSPGAGTLSAGETAKYDLLITNYFHHHAWAEDGKNSWQTLKSHNPDMIIALYMLGPGLYNTASWGEIGQGWEWMKQQHGAESGVRQWTASGHRFPYLAPSPSPHERLMDPGNTDWQHYWIDTVYHDFMQRIPENAEGVDAIFADNAQYKLIWRNQWFHEEHVGDSAYLDHPLHYADSAGNYDNDKWAADMRSFFLTAAQALGGKAVPVTLIPNFGYSGSNPEYWSDLDSYPLPLPAAMEEAGFVCPWPRGYSVWNWQEKLNAMKNMRNTAVLMTCMGRPPGTGLDRMDSVVSSGNMGPTTGWEALWYSLTSFLLALNQEKSNGYLTFSAWGYCENHWLDEFDPRLLHLGEPLDEYSIIDGVAYREYDDGWVVVNTPHNGEMTNLAVPSGRARVITRENFRQAEESPLVTTFDLGPFRGLILLKEGRKIGNEDNLTAVRETEKSTAALHMYPNPFRDRITLVAGRRMTRVAVFDAAGRMVFEQGVHATSVTIPLHSHPGRLFFIRAYFGDGSSTGRVLRLR